MKYRLVASVTVSAYTYVDADSEKEAIATAEDRPVVLGDDSIGNDPYKEWLITDADGEPFGIVISCMKDYLTALSKGLPL